MHHNGPGTGRVGHLDPADEGQQAGGVVWHSVVGPAGEVELLHLPHLVEASLYNTNQERVHYSTLESHLVTS